MTGLPETVERALESHDAFERVAAGYEVTTTVFDTVVAAETVNDSDAIRFELVISLPTLDAAVAGETVASVVEDGWFETLERRLEDTFSVAHTDTHEDLTLERNDETVRVVLEYQSRTAREGVDDAKTLIEYVEGTFAQGLIPGYEYRGEAATLLENAQTRGQEGLGGEPR